MNKKATRRDFLSATGAFIAASTVPAPAQSAVMPAIMPHRPTLAEVDVLVVGGGPAGIGAALGAARKGAKTLLIENHSFFGGVAAWSMGMQMNQMRPNGQARSQIHELLIDRLKAYGNQAVRLGKHEVWAHVEYLKVAVLDALDQIGCRYLVHVRAADAVVDCTGDADVAYYAGAET